MLAAPDDDSAEFMAELQPDPTMPCSTGGEVLWLGFNTEWV
ncbi:hypothetical protein [Roseateles sp. BYS87W]|uniref:Uncharacterized protein n=1 Tax=Pelomonas baiyunensis TaxID=3299026 RepID=A0ABW7H2W7_9BURK